ncbi:hypothetical protein PIB30_037492 [Stylosanthes scabra]|uniref:Uncharacterized protein n=1 Tax=Stylosanthes scabra TaxID=79078 RepID=A0ABU6XBT2_9FABA|nr:hypothetical protein [Stylosanthes scabra]
MRRKDRNQRREKAVKNLQKKQHLNPRSTKSKVVGDGDTTINLSSEPSQLTQSSSKTPVVKNVFTRTRKKKQEEATKTTQEHQEK